MSAEIETSFSAASSETSQSERLTAPQFLDQFYSRVHSWVEQREYATIIATFPEQHVENWEVIPDTREAGLGAGSQAAFVLSRGIIAEVDGDYLGVALGKGPRSYHRQVPRIQFGFVSEGKFRPDAYIGHRIALFKDLQDQGRLADWRDSLAAYERSNDFTPRDVHDLAALVRHQLGARHGEILIDDFGTVNVSAELDAGIYDGGEELRRWPADRLQTESGLEHTFALFHRIKNSSGVR
jgi:hypothetical protein